MSINRVRKNKIIRKLKTERGVWTVYYVYTFRVYALCVLRYVRYCCCARNDWWMTRVGSKFVFDRNAILPVCSDKNVLQIVRYRESRYFMPFLSLRPPTIWIVYFRNKKKNWCFVYFIVLRKVNNRNPSKTIFLSLYTFLWIIRLLKTRNEKQAIFSKGGSSKVNDSYIIEAVKLTRLLSAD